MYVVLWRFTTTNPAEFVRHYGPDGTWSALFARSPEYVRTDLVTDGDVYLTMDWWSSREAYERFRTDHASDYAALDAECGKLTASEEKVGEFAVTR